MALDKADPTQSTYLDFDKLLSYRRVVPSKILRKFSIGKMGHKSSLIMPMIIFMPFLSWSVFECFMLMDSMYRWTFWIVSCDICIGQVYIGVTAVIRRSGYFTATAEAKKGNGGS